MMAPRNAGPDLPPHSIRLQTDSLSDPAELTLAELAMVAAGSHQPAHAASDLLSAVASELGLLVTVATALHNQDAQCSALDLADQLHRLRRRIAVGCEMMARAEVSAGQLGFQMEANDA